MCVSDWRLGRMVRSVPRTSTGDGLGNVTIPPNPQRVGLTIFADGAGNIVSLTAIGNVSGMTAALSAGGQPVWSINITEHGDLPTQSFVVHNGGGAATAINWVEYYMPEKVFQKGIDYLKQEGFL